MTTYIGDTTVEDKATLEVYECGCGYHFGIDSSYAEQVGSINHQCPACGHITFVPAYHGLSKGDYV